MSSTHRDVARERGKQPRTDRRAVRWRWWSQRGSEPVEEPALEVANAAPPAEVSPELAGLLERLAHQIVEQGTASETGALEAVADATRWTAPGAAAALVDWDATEVVRLRAYGILHGVAVGVLGPADQSWLVDRLGGGSGSGEDGLVA